MILIARLKKDFLLKLIIIIAGCALFSFLWLINPNMKQASAASWTYCAGEGENCSFTGTKIVEYGWATFENQVWVIKKLTPKTYQLNGSSVEGVRCSASEFAPVSGAMFSNYCMVSEPEPSLDVSWSASVGEGNKSVTLTFSSTETNAGTLEELKNKISVKRTDEADFTALTTDDSVSNTTSILGGGTIVITFQKPLMGLDNQIRIAPGALKDILGDPFNRVIEINQLEENELGSWQYVGIKGISQNASYNMSLKFVQDTPYLAYIEETLNKLFVKKWDGRNWVSAGDETISGGTDGLLGTAFYLSTAVSGNMLYAAYSDIANGFKAYVKKYDGNRWQLLGGGAISTDRAFEMSIAISNGIPYLAYKDGANGDKLTVRKYKESDNSWELIGTAGISQDPVSQISLSVDNGVPYVAYRNEKPDRINVGGTWQGMTSYSGEFKKFDTSNGSWVNLGPFATGGYSTTYLTFNGGIPYVAYVDWQTGYGVTLKKYEGSSWTRVDNGSLKIGDSSNISYASFSLSDGVLYVACRFTDGTTAVKKFNGITWVSVGVSGITEGSVMANSLYVHNGIPYLANSAFILGADPAINRKPGILKFFLTAPVLTADSTSNNTESPIELTFPDLSAWRNEITEVKDGAATISSAVYTVSPGKITFNPGVLNLGNHTITVSTRHYEDAVVNQLVQLKPVALAADTTANDVAHDIVVSFPDHAAWRGAITTVKDGAITIPSESYTVEPGKITFRAGVLAQGDHTITISATDYFDTSITQIVKWMPSPNLTSDNTDNYVASAIDITFADDVNWRDEITAVKDGTKTMPVAKYSINAGKISFKAGALSLGSHFITVIAPNYDDAIVSQDIRAGTGEVISTDASLSNMVVDQGAMTFNPSEFSYLVDVANSVTGFKMTLTKANPNQTLSVTGVTYTTSSVTGNVYVYTISNLNVGQNPIFIDVYAQDGSSHSYVLTVKRGAPSSPSVQGGSGPISLPASPISTVVTSTDGNLILPVGKTGEVSLNKEVTISIPADASSQELNVTIDKVLDTQELIKGNETLASPIFEILKNFTENFSKPITLTFAFDQASIATDQRAAVFYFDETNKVWVEVPGGKVNGDQITVDVNHFTKYAVFAVDREVVKLNFSDISGHWAESGIQQAIQNGFVTGYPDGTFKPNHTVTRAEFAVMLMNTLKPEGEGVKLNFTDNTEIGAWAQKAIGLAVREGILHGYENGSFRPNAEITRAEMAVVIAGALGKAKVTETGTGFADDKHIAVWAKGSVAFMLQSGIMQGKGDNQFAPQDHATRAEAVTVLLKVSAQKSK
ncbi:DUF1533 domain-containing protein [Paenibacillus sp. LMG 31461]|uniref:DUF1533 domain-containing protein n=1 Tax=Paenibacillus plantarum TaxID=2654975 RepID=A0ABX1XIQ4_9BACL|nr:S-layer homology domain-containing protein [Paenibacillus plantarum]NOU67876.1 DUF1533 domain-containing protein [Paenibacillus plantarum]